MSDLFREVDEEIRHERYRELWKRWGPWVIGVALALVLVVGAYQGWQAYKRDQATTAAAAYAAALDKAEAGDQQAAVQALGELAESGPRGYSLVAEFRRAALQVEMGNPDAAVATWQAIAERADTPEPYGSLARIFAVMHRMDDGDPDALRQSLTPVAESDTPFRHTARELQGVLAAKAGEREKALELFKQVADGANVPQQQRQRANQMIAQLEG